MAYSFHLSPCVGNAPGVTISWILPTRPLIGCFLFLLQPIRKNLCYLNLWPCRGRKFCLQTNSHTGARCQHCRTHKHRSNFPPSKPRNPRCSLPVPDQSDLTPDSTPPPLPLHTSSKLFLTWLSLDQNQAGVVLFDVSLLLRCRGDLRSSISHWATWRLRFCYDRTKVILTENKPFLFKNLPQQLSSCNYDSGSAWKGRFL